MLAPRLLEGLTVPNSSAQVLVTLANGDVVGPVETFKRFDEAGHTVNEQIARDASAVIPIPAPTEKAAVNARASATRLE